LFYLKYLYIINRCHSNICFFHQPSIFINVFKRTIINLFLFYKIIFLLERSFLLSVYVYFRIYNEFTLLTTFISWCRKLSGKIHFRRDIQYYLQLVFKLYKQYMLEDLCTFDQYLILKCLAITLGIIIYYYLLCLLNVGVLSTYFTWKCYKTPRNY